MDFVQFSRTIVQVVMSRFYNCFAMDMILLTCLCSGQRVVVQEKKEDQVVENVVTIQVRNNSLIADSVASLVFMQMLQT